MTCFDGVNCIDCNNMLFEDGETKLFFDFGESFGVEGSYHDGFMVERLC